jgi:hypothetical protein
LYYAGTREREEENHKDWFDSAKQALLPLLAKRREAHKCWSKTKSKKDEGRFKKAKADLLRECRWAHNNEFWTKVSDSLNAAAAECDTNKFFAVQRTGFGYEYMGSGDNSQCMPTELFLPPEPGSNNPQVVNTPEGIKRRWFEHFYKLLNQLAEVNKDKLAEFLPKQQAELTNLAHKATHQEVCNALNFMGCDKKLQV